MVKRYAQDISKSGPKYARFVLSEVLSHQLHDVCTTSTFDRSMRLMHPHLVNRRSVMHDFVLKALELDEGDVFSHGQVRLRSGELCSKSDVVIIGDDDVFLAAQTMFFAQSAGQLLAVVCSWQILSYDAPSGLAICKRSDHAEGVELKHVLAPVAWSLTGAGDKARVLVPYQFRGLRPL